VNRLYLIRHAENPANLTKQLSCRLVDYSLTPKGVLQAQQTAEYFQDKTINAIYTSPLKRAMETAAIIAQPLGLQPIVIEEFRELNVGELEGQPVTRELWAYHDSIIEAWFDGKPEICFPGGEDYFGLWGRMRRGVEQALAGRINQNIIVVGHGGMFTFTLKDFCRDIDLNWLRRVRNHNCAVTEVIVTRPNGKIEGELISWASHAHLHGEAADLVVGMLEVNQTTNHK
jgi:probable phosphoglycerate mutase